MNSWPMWDAYGIILKEAFLHTLPPTPWNTLSEAKKLTNGFFNLEARPVMHLLTTNEL